MKNKKYLLEKLSCSNCATKIEKELHQLPEIKDVTLNFLTKELMIRFEDKTNINEVESVIKRIINKIESDVTMIDLTSPKEISYNIKGLDCANCAVKIEKRLKNTPGVRNVSVNYVANKLKITTEQEKEIKMHEIQKIIDSIEPGVKVNKEPITDGEKHKWEYARIIVGALLFAIGFLVNKDSISYLPLFIISYILIGGEVVFRAIKNIFKGRVFDENFLMTIATVGAFGIGEYPEAVAVMLFYQIGELFQDIAVNRSRRSIKNLMSIRPDVANLKTEDGIKVVAVEEVNVDDIIVVKPGERIPLDGIIIEGSSTLDTKALTGESIPTNVEKDDKALSGCININGTLTIEVTKMASESTVAKVLELVENATNKKAPTENFITKFARVYTPVVTIAAFLLATIPPLLIPGAEFSDWLYRSFIFLVISCPCALVVSIPLGFFGGIGSASRNGILVKGGNYLEALNDIEIAVFDKTGTLTEGSFVVTSIHTTGRISEDELLEKAAHVESFSNHPIAISVVNKYNKQIDQEMVKEVNEISGHGIKARYQQDEIIIGNARLMNKEQIQFEESKAIGSILYIAVNKEYFGNIVVSDQIKKDAINAIHLLKKLGIKKTVMLTGDKKAVALNVGKELGIDEVHAELLPEDKLNQVESLMTQKSKKKKLFFVGDGINDTPVLARADIGIAMGGLGADAAIDVSDVVIMTDEPTKIVNAIKIAKRTRVIVWQNIFFAFSVKLFFLVLGAFNIATMWEAVFADVGVALLAIFNAMRVLRYKV